MAQSLQHLYVPRTALLTSAAAAVVRPVFCAPQPPLTPALRVAKNYTKGYSDTQVGSFYQPS